MNFFQLLSEPQVPSGKEFHSTATGYGKNEPLLFVLSLQSASFIW